VPADDALLAISLRSVAGYGSFVALLIQSSCCTSRRRWVLAGTGFPAIMFLTCYGGHAHALPPTVSRSPDAPRLSVYAFVERTRAYQIRPHDLLKPVRGHALHNLAGVTLCT
jgi:hypothetical protein